MRNCPIDIRCGLGAREILRIRRTPTERFPAHKVVAAKIEAKLKPKTRTQAANEAVSMNPGPLTRSSREDVARLRGRNSQEGMDPPLRAMQRQRAERRPPVSRAAACLRFPIRI